MFSSAVYAGHWLESAREFVECSSTALAVHPVWLFSSGPVGDPARTLVQKKGGNPVDVAEVEQWASRIADSLATQP